MECRDDRHTRGPSQDHARPLEMAVNEIELALVVEDRQHRREDESGRIVAEARRAERLGHGRDEAAGDVRVARGERRDVVAAADELDDEFVDDALRAAVHLGRDALDRRGDLGDSQGSCH